MKAVLLAAGLGTRLRPITDTRPKCMVEVNGTSIIDKQITNLLINGFQQTDIFIIAGYLSDILEQHLNEKYPHVNVIKNNRYLVTNNMYSLFLAQNDVIEDDILLMNSDVFFDSSIIDSLLKTEGSAIACDPTLYLEESMKITVKNEKIDHISKNIDAKNAHAVSIDVYKLMNPEVRNLFKEAKRMIEIEGNEKAWTEVALDNIFCNSNFKPMPINGRWFEIDNHEDLAKASLIFSE